MDAKDSAELVDLLEMDGALGDAFKTRAALLISVLAMVLALASVAGSNAGKEAIQHNVDASNLYAFFQAKGVRQAAYRLAAEELETELERDPKMPPRARESIERRLADYRRNVARYESEPETGEGKKELLERARQREAERNVALRRDTWFDYSEGLLQIAIVIVSASIVVTRPALLWAGAAVGLVGSLTTLNGFVQLL